MNTLEDLDREVAELRTKLDQWAQKAQEMEKELSIQRIMERRNDRRRFRDVIAGSIHLVFLEKTKDPEGLAADGRREIAEDAALHANALVRALDDLAVPEKGGVA